MVMSDTSVRTYVSGGGTVGRVVDDHSLCRVVLDSRSLFLVSCYLFLSLSCNLSLVLWPVNLTRPVTSITITALLLYE